MRDKESRIEDYGVGSLFFVNVCDLRNTIYLINVESKSDHTIHMGRVFSHYHYY